MKVRVLFNAVVRGQLEGVELEAAGYHVDPRLGTLTITKVDAPGVVSAIVVYAAGSWRSVADVGALRAAVAAVTPKPEPQRENPRRTQEARQATEA